MDKNGLKTKFREYLEQKWESTRILDETTKRFTNDTLNIFLSWLESYGRDSSRSYKKVFLDVVVPQMKNKLNSFWDYYFKNETYKKYESLFVSFMTFAKENEEYISKLLFHRRKQKLENLVEWQYWKVFNKKAFLEAWHNHIMKDTWKNWDKLRAYLVDIYWRLDTEDLKTLYDVFFDSYKKCSEITGENHENKWKEGFERKDAFGGAFSHLESKLPDLKWETLSEVKSLFGKYLNFVPKYRDIVFNTVKWKPEQDQWKVVQKETEQDLIDNLSEEERAIIDEGLPQINEDPFDYDENPVVYENMWWRDAEWGNLWTEWDWFWPVRVIRRSRNDSRWLYDETERGDIIAPIDYWFFPDSESISEWDEESTKNEEAKSNNWAEKKPENPTQGGVIHFDEEDEKEEVWENPGYTGDYTDFYKNK